MRNKPLDQAGKFFLAQRQRTYTPQNVAARIAPIDTKKILPILCAKCRDIVAYRAEGYAFDHFMPTYCVDCVKRAENKTA